MAWRKWATLGVAGVKPQGWPGKTDMTPILIRDRKWLDELRNHRCLVTGQYALPDDPVEAAHIGTAGKGLKSSDNEAIPLLHSIHAACHQHGEISILRKSLPDAVFRAALRALARELYSEWLDSK